MTPLRIRSWSVLAIVLVSSLGPGCRERIVIDDDAGPDGALDDVGPTDDGGEADGGEADGGGTDGGGTDGGSDAGPGDAPTLVTLTVVLAGDGAGSVTSAPAGIDCGATCELTVSAGTGVALTASAGSGSSFQGWSGGGCAGTGTCDLTLTADTTVTATFALDRTLTVATAGTGAGTVASTPVGIDCGADCTETYADGTIVMLDATPDATSTFTGWTGDCTGTGPCSVTMSADRDVTASFALRTFDLTVSVTGPGAVTSAPAGIDCGATCSATFDVGTMVTLTAAPSAGARFTGWSGGGCSGTGSCVVTLSAATTVGATFVSTHLLTVTRAGTGTGTVSSAPAGIACGADCTETYDAGTMVTLTASAASGSTFAGWSGGGCSGTGTCAVTLAAATTVTATFDVILYTLTVTRAGTGTGLVTSTPAGISCGADCTEVYSAGTLVSLSATPAFGSTFTGWSGGGCTGTGACMVTLGAATTVTATFTLSTHVLTLARAGTGTGTVTSSPAGINCGVDCTETYNHGTVVTLTASPAPGSVFTGWSGGGCAGTGTCAVTMTAATTVTATFTLRTYTLTVARIGSGSGTVTSSPAGINCGSDCSEVYNTGTVVTLTAAASVGSTFTGWSGGGCSGTGTCVVTLGADTTVTPTFEATSFTTTTSWACGSGVSCQDVYDIPLPAGANVTISVTGITGASVLRLGAFAPGVGLNGANLLTGPTSDRMCGGQNVSDSVTFRAVTAGTYRIAVGRDWGSSAGTSGNYTLTVSSSSTIGAATQTVNDAASMATGTRCGFIYTVSTGWACAAGVSCQDVFDFTTLTSTTVTVAVSAITGASVPRLALFDGSALNTTNRLNGGLTDRRCVGQNINDSATSPALPTGLHRAAIGRDWGASAGGSGTYTVTITTPNAPLVIAGQTANDIASSFATTTCP